MDIPVFRENLEPCPKCGADSFDVDYHPGELIRLSCWRENREHLDVKCSQCTYLRTMPTKDNWT